MGSMARKQARELKRKLSGFSTPQAQAAIRSMQEQLNTREARIREEVARDVVKHMVEDITPQMTGDLILTLLMFLRCKRGYGKKRLQDFLHDFNEFADDAMKNGLTAEIVKQILMEECNFDVIKEFELCEEESNANNLQKSPD